MTETIFPERETALALATRVTGKAVLNFVRLGKDFGLQEMAVPTEWERKTLRELSLPATFGLLVVGVHDVLTDAVAAPDADRVLIESDTLIVAGSDAALSKVAQVK